MKEFEYYVNEGNVKKQTKDKRIVTSIRVLPNNTLLYDLSLGCTVSEHYDGEIERVKKQKEV